MWTVYHDFRLPDNNEEDLEAKGHYLSRIKGTEIFMGLFKIMKYTWQFEVIVYPVWWIKEA